MIIYSYICYAVGMRKKVSMVTPEFHYELHKIKNQLSTLTTPRRRCAMAAVRAVYC